MSKQAISLEEARLILRSLVLAKGEDYVYEPPETSHECMYFNESQPSCLIGYLFAVLGFTAQDLSFCEGLGASTSIQRLLPSTPDHVVAALRSAQAIQDRSGTWGEALAEFERVIEAQTQRGLVDAA